MPNRSLSVVVQQLRAAAEHDGAGRTDGELLTRFLTRKDDEALAALVERHAPMVWGVCCRLLHNPHDAEDAFQATFLVLVRKAATVLPREMVANWLYGVAQQTAVRLRATSAKRGWREMQMNEIPDPLVSEARESELLTLLDQELSRLPTRFRALIVLCDLEGNSRKEVARQLGCPEGTVASRLSRARDMLAKRMARHGLAVSGGSLATVISQSAGSAGVPISVVSRTIHVATLLAANQAVGVISGPVTALTEGVMKTMLLKKIISMSMVVLALGVAVTTGGSLAIGHTEGSGKPTFAADSKLPVTEKPVLPAKETSTVQNRAEAPPMKETPKALKVVVRLVDDATGQPIAKASWQWGWANPKKRGEFYFGHRGGESRMSDGTHEMQFQTTPETNLFRFRVVAAGYEPAEVVEEFPNPLPASLERTVRVKPGRRVAGTLRDHKGQPIANGQVFSIPKENATVRILEGVSDRASVSEARTDAQGKFELPTSGAGKLAASTEAVDLWPFALPPEGAAADLTLPAPAYVVLDLDYWYFDAQGNPGEASDRPDECRILVQGHGDGTMLWAGLEYHRQMLVYSRDPKAKLARGVRVENAAAQPAGGTALNRHVSAKVRIALPPGQYFVQRTNSAGAYHPKGDGIVTLNAGAETPLDWITRPGAAVRGMVKLPANHQFIQQPGAAPRKLDWTVPNWAYVHIDAADGKRRGSATIQHDGSFLFASHLEPGRYKLHTWITFPPKNNIDRGGEIGRPHDLDGTQEIVIPEPPADPAAAQPVKVELPLKIHGNRIVPAPNNGEAAPVKP
jgi:RNA polymerase sigma factor (sigma-70 family)